MKGSNRPRRNRAAKSLEPESAEAGEDLSTADLLAEARSGDPAAREEIAARYLGVLRNFAHGRLPARARENMDTGDLVQVTLTEIFRRLPSLEVRGKGALLAYMRQVILNRIRDEVRRVSSRPSRETLAEEIAARDPSPLDQLLEKEIREACEAAMSRLTEEQRRALHLRFEQELSYREIAHELGKPTANAARMVVSRALARLSKELAE